MKSTFAKIVDNTLGAGLVFFAATAVFAYFLPLDIAMYSALPVTGALFVLLNASDRKKAGELRVSRAADEMFFDLMFEDEKKPARLLADGLCKRGVTSSLRGAGLSVGRTAAYFPPDALTARTAARYVARAKRIGATKLVLFVRSAPPPGVIPDVAGFDIVTVCGDDVYKLFASLGALPERKYERTRKKRFAALRGALGKDRIVRYALLSAGLFVLALLTDLSPVALACAIAAALLFVASIINTLFTQGKGLSP